jgi:hypothetical protein
MLPLYQALMTGLFDHRIADIVRSETALQRPNQPDYVDDMEKDDPARLAQPTYWVPEHEVLERLGGHRDLGWLFGWRKITSPTNERTFIASPAPLVGVGDSILLAMASVLPEVLLAATSALAFDYLARQMLGGLNFQYYIAKQLPAPAPADFRLPCRWDVNATYADWIRLRVVELFFTALDMKPFARSLGDAGEPFRWDVDRRAQLRAELDACFFHRYGFDRVDTEYVLGTFPIANRKDPGLTARVLGAYDALAASAASGEAYVSPLIPPPGLGPRHPAI